MSTLSDTKSLGGISGKVWGSTANLYLSQEVEVALIRIKKGGFCSWHSHKNKFNRFTVISGSLEIVIDKGHCFDKIVLTENMSTDVKPGDIHQFRCHEDCIAMEIYWNNPLSAGDINRITDGGVFLCDAKSIDLADRTHLNFDFLDRYKESKLGKEETKNCPRSGTINTTSEGSLYEEACKEDKGNWPFGEQSSR